MNNVFTPGKVCVEQTGFKRSFASNIYIYLFLPVESKF